MRTMFDIVEQLRTNYRDQVRAIIERDDQTILLAYLEAQGFLSLDAIAKLNAEAVSGRGAYFGYLSSNHLTARQVREMSADDAAAHRADYARFLATDEGVKAVQADVDEKARVDSDATLAAEAAKEQEIRDANAAEDKLAADNAASARTMEAQNAAAAGKSMSAAQVELAKGTPGSKASASKVSGTMTSRDVLP